MGVVGACPAVGETGPGAGSGDGPASGDGPPIGSGLARGEGLASGDGLASGVGACLRAGASGWDVTAWDQARRQAKARSGRGFRCSMKGPFRRSTPGNYPSRQSGERRRSSKKRAAGSGRMRERDKHMGQEAVAPVATGRRRQLLSAAVEGWGRGKRRQGVRQERLKAIHGLWSLRRSSPLPGRRINAPRSPSLLSWETTRVTSAKTLVRGPRSATRRP